MHIAIDIWDQILSNSQYQTIIYRADLCTDFYTYYEAQTQTKEEDTFNTLQIEGQGLFDIPEIVSREYL